VTLGHTPGTSTPPTSRSAGRRPAWPEIEDLHRDVKALGLLVLEEGEASGLPHDLHHQQRRQGFDRELNLRSVEVFLMFLNVI